MGGLGQKVGKVLGGMKSVRQRLLGLCKGGDSWSNPGVWGYTWLGRNVECSMRDTCRLGVGRMGIIEA